MNALLISRGLFAAVDPEDVKPGWVALVIVLLLCVATFLLWRSMNRQLRKVNFDDGVDRSAPGAGPRSTGQDDRVSRDDGNRGEPRDQDPRA